MAASLLKLNKIASIIFNGYKNKFTYKSNIIHINQIWEKQMYYIDKE